MQNLALLLLLAVIASMIFTFDPSVLAQETPATPSDEGMTEEETSEEETAEEEISEEVLEEEVTEETEDTMEEETMEDTMEEDVDSPLEQMISKVEPHEIQCKSGQTLVFKASNWRPSCVNESSFDALVARGWVASHDPTHEDLTKMQDDYMAAHPQVEEEAVEEMEEEGVEEEAVEEMEEEGVEEETTEESTETETEGETQPQNYTINLSESISVSTI